MAEARYGRPEPHSMQELRRLTSTIFAVLYFFSSLVLAGQPAETHSHAYHFLDLKLCS